MANKKNDKSSLHRFFILSIYLKGIFSLFETLCGIASFFVTREKLINIINRVSDNQFTNLPKDVFASYLVKMAEGFSISTKHFVAFYLIAHGVVKLWLVYGLLREKLWYFPVGITIFGLFITYQLYRFTYTHSVLMICLTCFDALVIALTYHEYRFLRASTKKKKI